MDRSLKLVNSEDAFASSAWQSFVTRVKQHPSVRQIREHGFDWAWMWKASVAHLGIPFAYHTYTPEGFHVFLIMTAITGLSVTVGYHRLLTHQSFQTTTFLRRLLAFTGALANQDSALHWVADHRKHHQFSDTENDPHSARESSLHAHIGWMLAGRTKEERRELHERYVPDLLSDPCFVFLDRWHCLMFPGFLLALFGAGFLHGGPHMALSYTVWGGLLRMAFVSQSTWMVNSISHSWGYRRYDTKDLSVNNWFVGAIFSFGEGFHNTHHAYPRQARHGEKWWEFDTSFLVIRILRCFGLAWNVQGKKEEMEKPTAA